MISAYFALDNPAICKNIFSVLFFIVLANKIPFNLNLNLFFFKSIKNILYFVIFNFYFNLFYFFSIFKSLLSPYYYEIKNFYVFFSLVYFCDKYFVYFFILCYSIFTGHICFVSFSTKNCAFLGEINGSCSVSVDPKKLKEQKIGKSFFNSLTKDVFAMFFDHIKNAILDKHLAVL